MQVIGKLSLFTCILDALSKVQQLCCLRDPRLCATLCTLDSPAHCVVIGYFLVLESLDEFGQKFFEANHVKSPLPWRKH